MENTGDPTLDAAHESSSHNRPLLAEGGPCGCFYCERTFEASDVTEWVGIDHARALCPYCHIDAVLSAKAAPIDPAFLRRMHEHWFGDIVYE